MKSIIDQEKLRVNCPNHGLEREVKLTLTKAEKQNQIALDVHADCGCYLGKVETELKLK